MTTKEFEEITGCTLELKDGKPFYKDYLYLRGTGITSLPDGLTVGGSLYLRGTGITSLPDGLTVGGSLDLRGTGITSLPDGLTVGGNLDLENCTGITSLPDGLTVGGSLYLENCTGITSLPDGLTVGGSLDLRGTGITNTDNVIRDLSAEARDKIEAVCNQVLFWQWNDSMYVKADGVFSIVVAQKGNVYRTRQLGKTEIGYLITDGAGKWAHGNTLEEARTDLLFKICRRDKSSYENLTLDSTLSFDDAIVCYRVITGACRFGTAEYIENRLPQPQKEKYTIAEMIALTKGEYGNKQFAEFFKSKQ